MEGKEVIRKGRGRKSTQLFVCEMARRTGRSARSGDMSFTARRINHVNAARVIKAERLFIACNCIRGSAGARRETPRAPSIFDEVTAEAGEAVGGSQPHPPTPPTPTPTSSSQTPFRISESKSGAGQNA